MIYPAYNHVRSAGHKRVKSQFDTVYRSPATFTQDNPRLLLHQNSTQGIFGGDGTGRSGPRPIWSDNHQIGQRA